MNIIFPRYRSSFICACTAQDATKRISETVADNHNHLRIIELLYSDAPKIIVASSTGEYVFYNSFKPIVSIRITEEDNKTHISALFELQKHTKILMTIFSILMLLFEIMLFETAIQLETPALLCIPCSLMFLCYIFCSVGLLLSSKEVLSTLFVALTCGNSHSFPSIHKCNREAI